MATVLVALGLLVGTVGVTAAQGGVAPTPVPTATPMPASVPIVGATTIEHAPRPKGESTEPSSPGLIVGLSAANGRIAALRTVGDGSYELLVGDALGLRPAAGVEPLLGPQDNPPAVHLGTNARGRPVVVFPRCTAKRHRYYTDYRCDLASFDVTFGGEHRLPGVRRTGRSELEGVMDRGALLFSASSARAADVGLFYKPEGGRARRIAKRAGSELALSGSRIAHVISDGGKENGEEPCYNSTLVLRSTSGARRVVARDCIYVYASRARETTTPSFAGGFITWSAGRLFRQALRGRRAVESVGLFSRPGFTDGAFGFVPTGPAAGLAIGLTGHDDGSTPESFGDAVVPLDPLRWAPWTAQIVRGSNVDPTALD